MAKLKGVRCINEKHGIDYAAYRGDCVDVVAQMPNDSIGFTIYSPPFSSLYIYSDSEADMGNNANDADFFKHYRYLITELLRVTKPGRMCAVHCSDLPLQKWKDNVIALNDFPAQVSYEHRKAGWLLHSKVTIWKNPVVEMQRTKALGLLHKQLIKDSAKSRMGMADYLYVFRKPGDNEEFIAHDRKRFTVDQWQEWASPVWMDIRQTDTLNSKVARDQRDDKHLAPLQLDLIERAMVLWSNREDTTLSPFMGIGSEGYVSLQQKRRFVGVELKDTYYDTACKNLEIARIKNAGFYAG